jgi:hypothetical protein
MITEDQIRLEAYYYAEADDFKLSSDFYWNLAKEQLEYENMSYEDLLKLPNEVAYFTKESMIKARVVSKRAYKKLEYQYTYHFYVQPQPIQPIQLSDELLNYLKEKETK